MVHQSSSECEKNTNTFVVAVKVLYMHSELFDFGMHASVLEGEKSQASEKQLT
jgi:hypothetical protein